MLLPDAMLLAAGHGSRMRPLTDTRPKPLVEVAGSSLLDRVVDALGAEGVPRFVINAHYLAEQIASHFEGLSEQHPGCSFQLSREEQLLDTGGGVKNALPLLQSDPILVSNTDAFWLACEDRPLARLLAAHMARPEAVQLLCVEPHHALGFSHGHDFLLGPDGQIGEAGLPMIYTGVCLLPRHWFDQMPDGAFSMLRIFEAARAAGALCGVALNTRWFHVGDPDALSEAETMLGEVMA